MLALKASCRGVYCYSEACQWLDIGRVDDYQQANAIFEASVGRFLPDCK
jgi:NDP-sugar pyrophosphorylase family protein